MVNFTKETTSYTLTLIIIMSWKLGKSKKATLTPDRDDAASTRSITPTPGDEKPRSRTGILSIRVLWAEGLSVPQGTSVPAVVQAALSSQQAKVAASVSPASVSQSRLAARGKRDSVQRTQCWWLPYIVMEFEVNQILITPLAGELDKPLYMYQAHLYV
jgi:serum/glucocorticoid-regulated kinase 2